MSYFLFLLAGLLFGGGLTVSGMVNPEKILGFLDFAAIPAGDWDPTLAIVFAAGLAPMFVAYAIRKRMTAPLAATTFQIPSNTIVDARLVGGAALFGVGWGLAGLCPGPAITGLAFMHMESIVFVVAMFAGFFINRIVSAGTTTPAADQSPA